MAVAPVSGRSDDSVHQPQVPETLVVKNTFFEIVNQPATSEGRRSSSSVPASARFASIKCELPSVSSVSTLCRRTSDASLASMCSESTQVTESTEFSKSPALRNTFHREVSLVDDDDESVPGTAHCPSPIRDLNPADTPSMARSREVTHSTPPLAGLRHINVAAPGRTRLSTRAKAFTPSGHDNELESQIKSAVGAVQGAMVESGPVSRAEVSRLPQGWFVYVTMRPDRFLCKGWVLSRAREALVRATEASESLYILGYDSEPFAESPLGFEAVLAGMRDQASACWGMYSRGHCRRGTRCPWEHPSASWRLNVVVRPAH